MLALNRVGLFLMAIAIFGGCRAFDDDNGVDLSIENLLEPHPNGGCPEGAVDPFNNSESPQLGGDVEVKIEMSAATDFRCPFCAQFAVRAAEVFEQSKYKDFVRFYYHHFPLGMHVDAMDVHIRSQAVFYQGQSKFWRLHDEIFERSESNDSMSVSEIDTWIEDELDLDMDQFDEDVASDETAAFIVDDKTQAVNMGIDSVPRVIICGRQLVSWNNFEAVLDYYLGY